MSTVHAPTLTFPNGGETLVSPTITISWTPPHVLDDNGLPTWYEIYFTDSYLSKTEPDWVMLATLPSNATSFVWQVGNAIRSNNVRVAIRTRNSKSVRSDFDVCAANFTITRAPLNAPLVISPSGGGRYDNVVEVVITDGNMPKRNYYDLSYSSVSAGIPMTTIAQFVPSTSLPFRWDASALPAADDYVFYAQTVDRNGEASEATTVPIVIAHEGLFLLDTVPPETSVKLSAPTQFTRNNIVSISVFASDATTGVQAIQLVEAPPLAGAQDTRVPQPPQGNKTAAGFTLSTGDGVKTVFLDAQDFGGNLNDQLPRRIFTDCMYLQNSTVVDFDVQVLPDSESLFVVTTGDIKAVYQIDQYARQVASVADTPTSLAVYDNSVYVGTMDTLSFGHLMVLSASGLVAVTPLESLLAQEDTYIVDMVTFENMLYLAISDGRIISFDGSVTSVLITLPVAPESLTADDSILVMTMENDTHVVIYDGMTITEVST